jgi:hypothetical protein
MIGEDWVEKIKQYRLAIKAYSDAVDRIGDPDDLGREWPQVEVAHDEVERTRSALLTQRRKPVFPRTRSLTFEEVSENHTEDWVLGDLGQLGG